jgi:hypothetical protein
MRAFDILQLKFQFKNRAIVCITKRERKNIVIVRRGGLQVG